MFWQTPTSKRNEWNSSEDVFPATFRKVLSSVFSFRIVDEIQIVWSRYLCRAVSLSAAPALQPRSAPSLVRCTEGNIWLDRLPAGLRIVWIYRRVIHTLDTRHAENNSPLCMSSVRAYISTHVGAFAAHTVPIHFLYSGGGNSCCTVNLILFLIDCPSFLQCFVLPSCFL